MWSACAQAKNEVSFEIDFKIKLSTKEAKIAGSKFGAYISIANPSKDLLRLNKPNSVVIKNPSIILVIDYPLKSSFEFKFTKKNGFTRKELAELICKTYHEIYKQEDETSKTKVIPLKERKQTINRNRTNGKYGIWGHDIDDLALDSVEVKVINNKIYILLHVSS